MRIDQLWDDATRTAKPFSLLMIDVDNFKKYNDHYGHLDGDDCLRAIANSLDKTVQETSDDKVAPGAFVARYGGEEFCVVIPEMPPGVHIGLAATLVKNIAALQLAHEKNADWGIVTISVGAVCAVPAGGQVGSLFRQADTLLYRAKEAGRNRVEAE